MPERLIEYLPAIYQTAGEHSLLSHLLRAFEEILLTSPRHEGTRGLSIEDQIMDLARYFDPARTPSDFLPWLADWVALSLRAGLSEHRLREVIAGIIPLYARRGTRRGIVDTVRLFTGATVEIVEPEDVEFQIHEHSTIAQDTYLGGAPPHMFHVRYLVEEHRGADREERARREQKDFEIARWVVEMTKPAHTTCSVELVRRKKPGASGGERQEERHEPTGT